MWHKRLPIAGVARVWRPTSWAGPRPSRKSLNWLSEARRTPGKIRLKAKGHVGLNPQPSPFQASLNFLLASLVCQAKVTLIFIRLQHPTPPPTARSVLYFPASRACHRKHLLYYAGFWLCVFSHLVCEAGKTISVVHAQYTRSTYLWHALPCLIILATLRVYYLPLYSWKKLDHSHYHINTLRFHHTTGKPAPSLTAFSSQAHPTCSLESLEKPSHSPVLLQLESLINFFVPTSQNDFL